MKHKHIAWFISPHGFGHAARSAAMMQRVREENTQVQFTLVTTVPEWFFQESGIENFNIISFMSDVGLVQSTPWEEDLPATLKALEKYTSLFDTKHTETEKLICQLSSVDLVMADISPLGLFLAKKLGVPGVLMENFTWDWIYEPYAEEYPQFEQYIQMQREINHSADYHIKMVPYCSDEPADTVLQPVARKPKTDRESMREKLGISAEEKVVLISLGGIKGDMSFTQALDKINDVLFVIPGGSQKRMERIGNRILIPHQSEYYHPDLIHMSDAVIGKLGYSTIAEVWNSGLPFGYMARSTFRESIPLAKYCQEEIGALEIRMEDFANLEILKKTSILLQKNENYKNW